MSLRLRRILLTLLAGVVVLSLTTELTSVADAGTAAPSVSMAAKKGKKPSVISQHAKVSWKGNKKRRTYSKTAQIPGIGDLDLICRPDETRIRLYTANRQFETQMWMQKFENKSYGKAVAVKTARIYRYSNANDSGNGGTGYYANEGLNQQGSIENRSQGGYMYGVISQRSARRRGIDSAQIKSPRPVTTFELTWNWNGFDHPLNYRSCTIDAKFTTHLDNQRMGITWHGKDDPAPTVDRTSIPGIGTVELSCPQDREEPATLTVSDTRDDAALYVETVQGEGKVEDHQEKAEYTYDAETQTLGPPVPLPSNGSLRFKVTNGDSSRWFLLSSLMKRNDPSGRLNVCEVSAGGYQR